MHNSRYINSEYIYIYTYICVCPRMNIRIYARKSLIKPVVVVLYKPFDIRLWIKVSRTKDLNFSVNVEHPNLEGPALYIIGATSFQETTQVGCHGDVQYTSTGASAKLIGDTHYGEIEVRWEKGKDPYMRMFRTSLG